MMMIPVLLVVIVILEVLLLLFLSAIDKLIRRLIFCRNIFCPAFGHSHPYSFLLLILI